MLGAAIVTFHHPHLNALLLFFLLPSLPNYSAQKQYLRHCITEYQFRTEDYLPLPIELEDSVNKEAVAEFEKLKKEREEKGERIDEKDKIRAVIPLDSCLARLCQEEEVCQLSFN